MQDGPRYRVERRNRCGKTHYYLVKDIHSDGKSSRITKYMGNGAAPTEKEIEEFTLKNMVELETKARQKIIQSRLESLKTEYLSKEVEQELEDIRYLYKYINSLISVDDVAVYEQAFEQYYIHGTTAIEGNTLSLDETIDLLENGTIPRGKELREINEVQNYKRVAKYRNEYHGRITLDFIKKLHELIMANILEEPGEFRKSDAIIISGYDYQLTPALLIETELIDLINEYYTRLAEKYHPFECAVLFHYKFETIHPFSDGNGRVGRELLNYLLVSAEYPRLLILKERRSEYIGALKAGNNDDFATMVETFAKMIISQRKDAMENNMRNIPVLFRDKMNNDPKPQQKLDRFFDVN